MEGTALNPKLKIAIAIPVYGNPESMFMQSLTAMMSHFYEAKLTNTEGDVYDKELDVQIVSSSILTESRHRLAAEALHCGADYMLWCDADHVFPKDALCRLWSRNVDIVGCNYARRITPTAPTAAKVVGETDAENLVYTTIEKARAEEMEAVDHLGFGLCLMKMSIFDRLQEHAESEGRNGFMPLFAMLPNEDHTAVTGEDVFFFKKCRDAGLTVWCDHGVSWEVGHINKQIITNAHAVTQKDRWGSKQSELRAKFQQRIAELEAAE